MSTWHMAITDETAQRFVYGEKLNRAALGLRAPRTALSCGMRTGWPNGSARCSTWSGSAGYKLNLIVTLQIAHVLHGAARMD
jgi:hypothetical protein